MPEPLTQREQIVQHLLDRFSAQSAGTDGALITWDVVTQAPLSKNQQHNDHVIGIYDTSERVVQDIGRDRRALNIAIEFHCRVLEGEEPATKIRRALGEVQRVAGLDPQMTDATTGKKLALDLNEKGNELEVLSKDDRQVAGVVIYEVLYRTRSNSPFA